MFAEVSKDEREVNSSGVFHPTVIDKSWPGSRLRDHVRVRSNSRGTRVFIRHEGRSLTDSKYAGEEEPIKYSHSILLQRDAFTMPRYALRVGGTEQFRAYSKNLKCTSTSDIRLRHLGERKC